MKSAKALGTLCLAAVAAVNTAPALATDDGWYGGIGIGQARAKINDDKIRTQLGGTADIADDDTDIGYRLFGGKKFNKHFAVEGGYFNLGKFGFTAVAPTGSLVGSAKFQGLNLDAVGILPLTEKFSLLGRLGLTYTEAKDTFQTTGTVTVANASPSKSEANYKMGFGVQYDLTRALGLRGEWERYRVNDAIGNKGDIDMLIVGLIYTFGTEKAAPKAAEAPPPAPAPVAAAAPAPVVAAAPVLVIVPIVAKTQQYCSILDIQFEINQKTVQREAEEKIDKVGLFMKKYPNTTAVIEGHSDEVGSATDNMKLSEQRAASVVTYLVDRSGINRSRLKSVGYGETRPIADNKTDAGKRLNRRINAIIACASDIEGIAPIPDRITMAMELEFDRNSDVVKPQYREELRKVANFMKANPKVKATVEGHTGNLQASPKLAMEISQRRAQNVANYLATEFDVPRSRLAAEGFGQTRRFAYNTSLEGQQENRRVNIILDFPS
jgi:OOP family OmpA-OmpF porin